VTIAILCSGQGRQHPAMFDVVAPATRAQPIFAAATALLDGRDPRQWIRDAKATDAYGNQLAQLLCCTQSLAAWAALESDIQALHADCVIAGYSVGELAAWGCAGLLAAPEILRLARFRAQAMDAAATEQTGLLAVRGLSRSVLQTLCERQQCEIAIILATDSFVVGGISSRLQRLQQEASKAGAQRYALLPISVAAHTSVMAAASTAFRARLAEAPIAKQVPQRIRLLSGIDGDVVMDVSAGIDKLAAQISQPLDWQACLIACQEAGVSSVLELGPGSALAHTAREAIPTARCRSIDDFKSLDGVRAWLRSSLS
jgi:[acyl-carrier-protein] S-malonyltransferase